MRRFFFDASDGRTVTMTDGQGSALPDLASAKAEAHALVLQLASGWAPTSDHGVYTATVRDEDGSNVFRVILSLDVIPAL